MAFAAVLLLGPAAATADEAASCGSRAPAAPLCNVARCSADAGWLFFPVAAGAPCTGGGYCDGGIPGPPGQVEPIAPGSCVYGLEHRPAWIVQAIVYLPPGARSYVQYGSGSGVGGKVSEITATSDGGIAGALWDGAGGAPGFTTRVIDEHSLATTKTDASTWKFAAESGLDAPDRWHDLFVVWTNPVVTHFHSSVNHWEQNVWSVPPQDRQQIFRFTAAEIAGLEQIPSSRCLPGSPADPCAYLKDLGPEQRKSMLDLDAPLRGAALDPARYQPVERQDGPIWLHGPASPADTSRGLQVSASYDSQYDSINGSFVSASPSAVAVVKMKDSSALESATQSYAYADVRSQVAGSQQIATLYLETPTVGCVMGVDVYIDAAFGTYLVLPTQSAGCR